MKKRYILVMGMAVALAACQTEKMTPGESTEDDRILVSLALTGEVTVNEEPLVITRAGETSSKDLYGVQVYENDLEYAYGLFDNVSDMKIYLHSGKTYSFECTLIKDGKEKLMGFTKSLVPDHPRCFIDYTRGGSPLSYVYAYYFPNTESSRYYNAGAIHPETSYPVNFYFDYAVSYYSYPFVFVTGGRSWIKPTSGSRPVPEGVRLTNSFSYASYGGMALLPYSLVILSDVSENEFNLPFNSVQQGDSFGAPLLTYPQVDRYYGKSGSYTATYGNTTPVTIEMKHVVFGVKYKITGITDGSVSITIKNDDKTFFEQTGITADFTSEQKLYCFTDILSAWQYADGYAENVTVSMTWARGVGVTQDLGSQVVQVKRNAMNTINISLGSDDGGAKLGVNPENAEMGNLSYEFSSHY